MPQLTFDNTIVEVKQPQASRQPAEKKILLCIKYHPGSTHDQIRNYMRGSGIGVFDNKLRSLRAKGFIESHKDEALDALLWYVTEGIKI